jgi:hypothetical protein
MAGAKWQVVGGWERERAWLATTGCVCVVV